MAIKYQIFAFLSAISMNLAANCSFEPNSVYVPLSCLESCIDRVMNPYFTFGVGVVFPTKHSDSHGNSTSILFAPTVPSISLFTLPHVVWENKYNIGFEVSGALGCSLASNWRVETEFLYQNLERKISGHYDWREFDVIHMTIFDQVMNNPVQNATKTANLYCAFANIYNDFRSCSNIIFSVGGGIGAAWLQSRKSIQRGELVINTTVPPIHETAPTLERSPSLYGAAFAWQVKLGLSYDFMQNISVGLNYRLFGTTKFKASNSMIITNPNTPAAAVFEIPQGDVKEFINNSIYVTAKYRF